MTDDRQIVILLHRRSIPVADNKRSGSAENGGGVSSSGETSLQPVPMPHWDWLFDLDPEQPLRTYSTAIVSTSDFHRSMRTPDVHPPPTRPVTLEAWHRADHRRRYLTYRGPIRDGSTEVIEVARAILRLDADAMGATTSLATAVADWQLTSACGDVPLDAVARIECQRRVDRGDGRYQLRLFRG